MTTVCVWRGRDSAWYWDDSEDHGGFDRISPMGPHDTEAAAEADARDLFPCCEIEAGPPLHYCDGDEPGAGYLPEGFTLISEWGETLCERCGSEADPGAYGGESLCMDCKMSAQDGDLYGEGGDI